MYNSEELEEESNGTHDFDDKYLFIGLTSGAIKNHENQFVNHVESIFKRNETAINERLDESGSISDDLYKPIIFNVFGDYDYAFLCLSDTFQFGAKNFRPYGIKTEDLNNDLNELPFQYQCFYGPHLVFKKENKLKLAQLKKFEKKLCLGICQIKLNNSLVIGGAMDFLKYSISKINAVLKKKGVEGIISLSFSWHELTLVCFSDNYYDLYFAIKDIRNLELNNLCKNDEDKATFPHWYQNTLHAKLKQDQNNDPISLIKETNTKFGYQYQKDKEKQLKIIKRINEYNGNYVKNNVQNINSGLRYVTRVWVKPERTVHLISKIRSEIPSFVDAYQPRYVSGRAVINYSTDKLFSLFSQTNVVSSKYLRKISTFLEFNDVYQNCECDDHHGLQHQIFKTLEVDLQTIEQIRIRCSDMHYPKMTTERIMRILVNYNRNISDPAIFSYFMELKGPIDYLLSRLQDEKNTNPLPYLEANTLLDELENAFWTRYYHTPQFIYNGDTSTEHSGGILQILSCYDFASRKHGEFAFSNQAMYETIHNHHTIINLTTNPGIKSTEKSIQINFYHLFQPSLLAATLMHECYNYFPSKLVGKFKILNSLLPLKDKEGSPDIWNRDSFEYFINERCGLYIYFDKDWTSTKENKSEERNGLYHVFSENGMRILLLDYITWTYAYNRDTELFLFWHFGSILQDTAQY
ncbi:MAG: hypothetical protein AAGA77_25855, partial [Bacteroidota bacterium]